MKKEKKSILDYLRSLFKKDSAEEENLPTGLTEETARRLIDRALGEKSTVMDSSGKNKAGEAAVKDSEDRRSENDSEKEGSVEEGNDAGKDKTGGKKESCPYATKRAIVESVAEIRRFADEHKLAASVLKSLLALLAEIALGALRGKVSRQILETLLRALNYELAVEEAFQKGHSDGRKKLIEERFPADDDGLPHINGTLLRGDSTSIFDVAAECRN